MKKLIQELMMAKNAIGSIPATHNAQEIVVVAKAKITKVVAALEEMEKEAANGQTD